MSRSCKEVFPAGQVQCNVLIVSCCASATQALRCVPRDGSVAGSVALRTSQFQGNTMSPAPKPQSATLRITTLQEGEAFVRSSWQICAPHHVKSIDGQCVLHGSALTPASHEPWYVLWYIAANFPI
jgi:hypothetical protein